MILLQPLLLEVLQTIPPNNGISVDTTIPITWVLGAIGGGIFALAVFLFGLWDKSREHSGKLLEMREIVANSHINTTAEAEKMRQQYEILLHKETQQRQEDMRKMETEHRQEMREMSKAIITIHEEQTKISVKLEGFGEVLRELKQWTADQTARTQDFYKNYQLTKKGE